MLCVSRSGGDWVLLCGDPVHYSDEIDDSLITIHWSHLVERDETLKPIIETLKVDFTCERKAINGEWHTYFDPDSDR